MQVYKQKSQNLLLKKKKTHRIDVSVEEDMKNVICYRPQISIDVNVPQNLRRLDAYSTEQSRARRSSRIPLARCCRFRSSRYRHDVLERSSLQDLLWRFSNWPRMLNIVSLTRLFPLCGTTSTKGPFSMILGDRFVKLPRQVSDLEPRCTLPKAIARLANFGTYGVPGKCTQG